MRIIGLVGKKQVGKDTVFEILKEFLTNHPLPIKIVRVAFADALKDDVADFCHVTLDDIERNKEQFRLILQGYGTDFRRRNNPRYWVDRWQRKCQEICQHVDIIVATDVRFLNEAEMIKDMRGELWRIKRFANNTDFHISELEQDRILVDKEITNYGTKQELEEKIKKLI